MGRLSLWLYLEDNSASGRWQVNVHAYPELLKARREVETPLA